ncbi:MULTISPECIES: hypothetical protein [unclassified Microbacterium]|uniref:hypothetical protein n=1 Tax=unclassified Microbacterium TaxID=2609290 RepID=UPI0037470D57
MKLKFAKAAAALTIAAGAVFVPVAANAAAPLPYPPTPVAVVSGNTVNITFEPGSFAGAENVTIIIIGYNASDAAFGAVKASAADETKTLGTVTAAADGSVSQRIVLPADARGTYTVRGTSDSRPAGLSTTFVVAGGTGGAGGLPATGMDSGSLLGLWAGGGALVLAGGAVAVGAAVHRQRKQTA